MVKSNNSENLNLPIKLTGAIAEQLKISPKSVSQILNGWTHSYSYQTIMKVYKLARKLTIQESEKGINRIDKAIEKLEKQLQKNDVKV